MTHQFLSEKMCRLLSSLVPGFEGHWVYVYWGTSKTTSIYCRSAWGITAFPENGDKIICPAWQAEDLLRNWTEITVKVPMIIMSWHEKISWLLVSYPDTAYQKIEEYLWEILGCLKAEECTGTHCKCMQSDCANHHYNDHKK